jgi:hypothetical protein
MALHVSGLYDKAWRREKERDKKTKKLAGIKEM